MAGYEAQLTEASEDAGPGPGRRLRLARERRELSVTVVADALHLERRIIEAIEADHYEELPPITFTRGYLRSYARFVNVPEDEVLDGFDRLGVRDRQRPLPADKAGARRAGGLSAGTPWLLVLLAAAVLAVAWWFWYYSGSLNAVPAPQAQSPAPASETEAGAGSTEAASETEPLVALDDADEAATPTSAPSSSGGDGQAGDGLEAVPDAVSGADVSASGSAEPGVAHGEVNASGGPSPGASGDGSAEQAAASPASTGTPSTSADATEGGVPPEQAAAGSPAERDEAVDRGSPSASDGDQASASAAGAASVTGSGPAELVFEFSGESWMEVTDAGGERLLFGLVSGGSTRTLRGEPPFDIVVGDVGAVALRYNGEAVSLESRASGRVARFSMGESP